MNPRRLYRSRDRQLAGVAGGMAEYLDIDPTIIRIAWILVTVFTGGLAIIAYILLALVIPQSPYAAWSGAYGPAAGAPAQPGQPGQPGYQGTTGWAPGYSAPYAAPPARPETRGLGAAGIVGIVLVVIGVIALADVTLPGVRAGIILGPAVILALGGALLVASIRRPAASTPATPAASSSAGASADPAATGYAYGAPASAAYPYGTPAAPWPDAPDLSRPATAPAAGTGTWEATDTQAVDPGAFGQPAADVPAVHPEGDPNRAA